MKLYCIFAKDVIFNVPAGKLCGQSGHAFIGALMNSTDEDRDSYLATEDQVKIVLLDKSIDRLLKLQEAYKDICGTYLVEDKGYTVFTKPTITCLGIGPISEDKVGKDLKRLRLMQ